MPFPTGAAISYDCFLNSSSTDQTRPTSGTSPTGFNPPYYPFWKDMWRLYNSSTQKYGEVGNLNLIVKGDSSMQGQYLVITLWDVVNPSPGISKFGITLSLKKNGTPASSAPFQNYMFAGDSAPTTFPNVNGGNASISKIYSAPLLQSGQDTDMGGASQQLAWTSVLALQLNNPLNSTDAWDIEIHVFAQVGTNSFMKDPEMEMGGGG